MAFEIVSFLIGVAAGGLACGLAAILHGLERVADLQDRVRKVATDVQRLKASDPISRSQSGNDPKPGLDDLQRDLDEINEEIKRMYKRA